MDKKNSLLRILLIEDSDMDAFTIQNAIREYKEDAQCTRVSTLKLGEDILQKEETDVLLLDLGLPDTAGPEETYEKIKKWAGKLPVIIMTNLQDHELARVMVHEGAADFVNKDSIAEHPKLILDAIDFSIERHAVGKKILSEKEEVMRDSQQKDTILRCFMGGYSVSSGDK